MCRPVWSMQKKEKTKINEVNTSIFANKSDFAPYHYSCPSLFPLRPLSHGDNSIRQAGLCQVANVWKNEMEMFLGGLKAKIYTTND